MSSLFTIGLEFRALNDLSQELIYDEETGEILDESQTIQDLFDGINEQLTDKLDNTMYIIKQMEANEKALKEESKRLAKRATTLNNRIHLLRDLMLGALQASNQKKLVTTKFNYSIRKSQSVNVHEVEDLPREYVKLTRTADKMKIKEKLKEGWVIEGCSLNDNFNLGVK